MGICNFKDKNIPVISNQGYPDESFYCTENKYNDNKFLLNLPTFPQAQFILTKHFNNIQQQQNKKILQQHINQMEQMIEKLGNQKSTISQILSTYQNKKGLILFQIIHITLRKIKILKENLSIKLEGEKQTFLEKIQFKDYFWIAQNIFLEWEEKPLGNKIEVKLGKYSLTINCQDLMKYQFPVVQAANFHQRGSLEKVGKLFFRAQCISDIRKYKVSNQQYSQFIIQKKVRIVGYVIFNNSDPRQIQELAFKRIMKQWMLTKIKFQVQKE